MTTVSEKIHAPQPEADSNAPSGIDLKQHFTSEDFSARGLIDNTYSDYEGRALYLAFYNEELLSLKRDSADFSKADVTHLTDRGAVPRAILKALNLTKNVDRLSDLGDQAIKTEVFFGMEALRDYNTRDSGSNRNRTYSLSLNMLDEAIFNPKIEYETHKLDPESNAIISKPTDSFDLGSASKLNVSSQLVQEIQEGDAGYNPYGNNYKKFGEPIVSKSRVRQTLALGQELNIVENPAEILDIVTPRGQTLEEVDYFDRFIGFSFWTANEKVAISSLTRMHENIKLRLKNTKAQVDNRAIEVLEERLSS